MRYKIINSNHIALFYLENEIDLIDKIKRILDIKIDDCVINKNNRFRFTFKNYAITTPGRTEIKIGNFVNIDKTKFKTLFIETFNYYVFDYFERLPYVYEINGYFIDIDLFREVKKNNNLPIILLASFDTEKNYITIENVDIENKSLLNKISEYDKNYVINNNKILLRIKDVNKFPSIAESLYFFINFINNKSAQ